MLQRLRRRVGDERAFTLVELLVVIFATARQTCADHNSGSYASCTLAQVRADEPSLSDTATTTLRAAGQSQTGYTLTSSVAATGDVFTPSESNGVEARTCTAAHAAPANAGCDSGTW
jgi:hypothetical protein